MWTPSIIVVERTCLFNNDQINLSKNFEMPVVDVLINKIIGLNDDPFCPNRFDYNTNIYIQWITLCGLRMKYK